MFEEGRKKYKRNGGRQRKEGGNGAVSVQGELHHLQPLPFGLCQRANRFDFHGVLLHQVFQSLHQLVFEMLLLFCLPFDFTKVFFILLLYGFRLHTRLFLGL